MPGRSSICACAIRNRRRFGQRIVVTAGIKEFEHRLRIAYLITDAASGRRMTRGSTVQVAVDMATNEVCFASPRILLDKLGVAS